MEATKFPARCAAKVNAGIHKVFAQLKFFRPPQDPIDTKRRGSLFFSLLPGNLPITSNWEAPSRLGKLDRGVFSSRRSTGALSVGQMSSRGSGWGQPSAISREYGSR